METPRLQDQFEVRGDDGNVYGPETAETIRRWHAEHRLEAQSEIRRVGETEWRPLSAFEQLKIPSSKTTPNPIPVPTEAPGVILWYRIYNVLTAVMYLGLVALLWWSKSGVVEFDSPEEEMEVTILAWVFLVIGLPLAIFHLVCCFMTNRRWHWMLGFFPIGIGMTGCCLPFCIPLLIFWLKPETKAWLGRNQSQ